MIDGTLYLIGVEHMDHEIKSAREIAMEKIAGLGIVTADEKLKWKYVPEGEQLAIKYLKDGQDLNSELQQYPENAQQHVKNGAEDVLLSAIQLPKNETIQNNNKKAMDGLLSLTKDKTSAAKMLNQMKQILGHYTDQGAEQRQQTYTALKSQFEAKLRQAVNKQLGTRADTDLGIKVETLPQFQDEWGRALAQMDDQYIKLLEEYKKELRKIK
jgi:VCBS repeat-containing protein